MAGDKGTTIANAYVAIIPSADGATSAIARELGVAGEAGGTAAKKGFIAKLGDLGKKLAPIVTAAAGALAVAGAAMGKAAVDAYADYEQLIGGVETLYGDAADTIIANANRAFRTAGISANSYMEQSTSFAAALVNSLGGDTQAAAMLADVAISDMADNANKMGTSLESLQYAYSGFSRGVYTLLDNLKIGYGGTRTEMERLLADAEAISGIHYDISSYSDVVSAIHVIQEEMGITGTTAQEAATTISGSWASLQASWENLLVSIAGGGEDIETSVQQVFDSLLTWLGNVVPRIGEIVGGIFQAIPAAAAEALPALRDTVMGFLRDTFGDETTEKLLDFINTLHGAFDRMAESGAGVIEALSPLAEFFSGQGEKFDGMMERISQHLADFQVVMDERVVPAFTTLMETMQPIIDVVVPAVIDVLAAFGSAVVGLAPIIADFVAGVATVFNNLLVIAQDVWNGIKSAIEDPIGTAKEFVRNAIDKIKGFFNFKFEWPHIPLPHFSISGSANPLDWLSNGLPSISVSWYAKGGIVDGATLIGAGERGKELIIPGYEPELSRWADALAEAGAGRGDTYYIDGSMVAADARLAAALDVVAERVGGRRRMGVA